MIGRKTAIVLLAALLACDLISCAKTGSKSDDSAFRSVMREVRGKKIATYEAFDPLENRRVQFCRSCLEKREQEDNARRQRAIKMLQSL